jgi:cell division protein FtsL
MILCTAEICSLLWLNSEALNHPEAELAKKSTAKSKNSMTLPKTEKNVMASPVADKTSLANKMLIGFVVVIVLLLTMFFLQPDEYTLEHEITIKAPVEKIFEQVNDLHNWAAWSPWEKSDPDVNLTYDGKRLGLGSVCHWKSTAIGSEANMVITESVKNDHVSMLIDIFTPSYGRNNFLISFEPKGTDTLVKWHVTGPNSFDDKISHVFGGGDKTLDKNIQTGLEQLKALFQSADKT